MTTRLVAMLVTLALVAPVAGAPAAFEQRATGAAPASTSEAALNTAIDNLGAFDLTARTQASKVVRRALPQEAVPALTKAARAHKDEYVRYRALVLLTGFGDATAGPVIHELIGDKDDRIRTVVYSWLGLHPDPAVLPKLLAALDTEHSEFVRPILTRAVAAYGDDARARAALLPLVGRGADLFRGAVIEAIGDYHGRYAGAPITEVAQYEGPLQDEAVLSLGKMGDASALPALSALQKNGPADVQPAIAVAVCLITTNCTTQEDYLKRALAFSAAREGQAALLSRTAHAIGALGTANRQSALVMLFDQGVPAKDPVRSVIAVSIGTVALQNPGALITALESRTDLSGSLTLLRDAFDMLSEEDYGQERFYTALRQAATSAPVGSKRRQIAAAAIDALEF